MSDRAIAPNAASPDLPPAHRNMADGDIVKRLRGRLPRRIAQSFSDAQLRAVATAFTAQPWKRHRTDLRLTLPFFKKRLYFVLVAGSENRSPRRRQADRAAHPLVTAGNVAFAVMVLSILQIGALGVLYVAMSLAGMDISSEMGPAIAASLP